jgi:hypothetical protein
MFKIRAGLLGLFVLLLVSSVSSVSASAEPGPYCYHREIGGQGKGTKISAQTPEPFAGGGPIQSLRGKIAGTEVEISAEQAQVKGIIYNNPAQCQSKIKITYINPKLSKPEVKGCVVKVGKENTFELKGHEAYKWDETKKQLEEQPQQNQKIDWIFLPGELKETAKELPKETFVEITFSTCGVFIGTFKVSGSAAAERTPEGKFSTKETQKFTKGEAAQHWWRYLIEGGKAGEFVGQKTGLTFGTEPASYEGTFNIESAARQQNPRQEIAQWEQ